MDEVEEEETSSSSSSSSYQYVAGEAINDHLHCGICAEPFVDPVVTPCGHTFCAACLRRLARHAHSYSNNNNNNNNNNVPGNTSDDDPNHATATTMHTAINATTVNAVEETDEAQGEMIRNEDDDGTNVTRMLLRCPMDRQPFDASEVRPADRIIRNLVDELPVYCPHRAAGCDAVCLRGALASHVRETCAFAPVPCEFSPACGERFRRSELAQHVLQCPCRPMPCDLCHHTVPFRQLEVHKKDDCEAVQVHCLHCKAEMLRGQLATHYTQCPLLLVPCVHHRFGCAATPTRESMKDHLKVCPLESIKDYLQLQETKNALLVTENENLKAQLEMVQKEVTDLRQQSESQLRRIEGETVNFVRSQEMDQTEQMIMDRTQFMEEIQVLRDSLHSLEISQHVYHSAENIRLKEELDVLHSLCQSLQAQIAGIAAELRSRQSFKNPKHSSRDTKNVVGDHDRNKL